MDPVTITGHGQVEATLDNPDLVVPPAVGYGWQPGSIGWLRASVARFSSGAAHQRRRALAVSEMSTVDVGRLRSEAFERTKAVLREAVGRPIDLMAAVARPVPVGVLADELGLTKVTVEAVVAVAKAYPAGDADAAAEAAVAELVEACGGVTDEATAARIGLLVQACDATAGLVGNGLLALLRNGPAHSASVDAVLTETLRHDPPVLRTRRTAVTNVQIGWTQVAAGGTVALDLAGANRDPNVFADPDRFDPARPHPVRHLTFGAGPHACPGHELALELAAGVLAAAAGCRLHTDAVDYEPSANLRIPVRLEVVPS